MPRQEPVWWRLDGVPERAAEEIPVTLPAKKGKRPKQDRRTPDLFEQVGKEEALADSGDDWALALFTTPVYLQMKSRAGRVVIGDDKLQRLLTILAEGGGQQMVGVLVQALGIPSIRMTESLEVMLVSRRIDHRRLFAELRCVIIDEVHAFAEVEIDWVGNLRNAALVISRLHRGEKRLVFCDSRARMEELALELRSLNVSTYVSHSCLSLEERRAAEEAFSQGNDCVIVATSTLELGIDVGDLDRVIQIDAPSTVSSFLQRIGRTGRRKGTSRNCLFLVTREDAFLQAAALALLWSEGFVEPVQPPPLPFHIFAQQIMGLALQEGGISTADWRAWLGKLPGLSEVESGRLEQIIEYMIDTGILHSDQGLLGIGRSGEWQFGKKNFMELFSVFLSPPLVKVFHGKQEIGEVHQSTFILKKDVPSVLTLAGRSWETKYIDWPRRKAYVEPTSLRGRSQWLGAGQPLHFQLCQAVARVLAADDTPVFFSKRAKELMDALREEFSWVEPEKTFLIIDDEDNIVWWTFAGNLVNASIAQTLAGEAEKVTFDNLSIRFSGTARVDSIKRAIRNEIFSDSAELAIPLDEEFIAELKFGECLPQDFRDGELAAWYAFSDQSRQLSEYSLVSISTLPLKS